MLPGNITTGIQHGLVQLSLRSGWHIFLPAIWFSSVVDVTLFYAVAKAAWASSTRKCSSSVSTCWADFVTQHGALGLRELCT